MAQKEYRWASPQEWLIEQVDAWSHELLLSEFKRIVAGMDADEIQDNYLNEMVNDGYFRKERRKS